MARIRLTKNELKKQKDDLKRFTRYLPTLELKKQQLIQEIRRIQERIDQLHRQIARHEAAVYEWVDLFAEEVDWPALLKFEKLVLGTENVAGIDIPVLMGVLFAEGEIDPQRTPLWVDPGVEALKKQIQLDAALRVSEEQRDIIQEELRVTVQRIKLFEEVKIPEARENIRTIQIALGDQQTAAVVRGKIAKGKIESKKQGVAAL